MMNTFSTFLQRSLLVGLSCWATFSDAQISLSATGGTLTGSYSTLEAAFTAINSGTHTGAITISVTGNTTETISAVLNASGSGATSYTSVVISPTGGATRTISGSIAAPLIDLNGADNVTFNGLNTGGNALVLDNQNTGTGTTSTIRFINDASSNMIQNCTILGASTTLTTASIVFSTADATLLQGNDNNTITNCTLDASGANFPSTAIVCVGNGTAGQENSGINITNNNIANFFNAAIVNSGISVSSGGTAWTITGNKLYQSAARTFSAANTHKGIRVASGAGHTISNNTIGFANAAGTGVYTMNTAATRFIAIDLAVGTTPATSVQGNIISSISLTTTSGAAATNGILCGINITSGNVNVGTIAGNTIGAATGTGSFAATTSSSTGLMTGIHTASSGTIVIQNNIMGGFLALGTTAAIATAIMGVNVSNSAAALTISNNTIGNSTANNMQAGTLATTTASIGVSGINFVSSVTVASVTNNTIQNMAAYGANTGSFVRGIWTLGSTGNPTVYTITGNTIHHLTTNSTNTSFSNGQAGAVGICLAAGTNSIVSNNTIYNIDRSNTGTISGFSVGISIANTTSPTISRNLIYNITNASTATSTTAPGIASGIAIRNATTDVTVTNNMISLGNGQTTNTCFIGIHAQDGTTPDPLQKIYYNTINIEGTVATGAQPSFGFLRGDLSATARTATLDFRNNLITNTRSGGTGAHFAIANNYGAAANATGWGVGASDNNVLNANAATVGYWGSNQTFAGWKTASAGDVSSYSGIAVAYVNSANDLHLNMGVTPTSIESGAVAIPGVATDYDNQNRPGPTGSVNGGGTLPDIGADEIDAVFVDAAPPAITYTALLPTCQTTDRTLTATITDLTGVPTTGTLQPRIYYRKNTGAWVSTTGALSSGTATNGTWSFNIIAANVGGLVLGDRVEYYVIAQDVVGTPNIVANPAAGLVATDVNNVTTAPTNPNAYNVNVLMGSYTVGAAGVYPTLTAAINAYNTTCLGGAVNFSLIDATYPGETFPITINANAYASASNSLTIKAASGVTPTITGSSATALLILNGADFINLEGGNGSGTNSICPRTNANRVLTLNNTNAGTTSAVISLQTTAGGDAATNNNIVNCNIIGNTNTTTFAGINISGIAIGNGTGANGNNNNQITNNTIQKTQIGIYSSGASSALKNQNNVFNLNDMTATSPNSIGKTGIAILFENAPTVRGNNISNISSTTSDVIGISLGSVLAGNNITTGSEVTNATIAYNTIDNLVESGNVSAVGINLVATSTGSITTISNNVVNRIFSNGQSPEFAAGIYYGGGAGTLRIYNNTVQVTGTTLTGGDQPIMALGINGTTPNVDIRNNILICTGDNGASLNTGIGLAYTSTLGNYANLISNNNDIFVSGTGAAIARVGSLSTGTAKTTLAAWQTETGRDLNSQNVSPVFMSASNLHLDASSGTNTPLFCGGTSLAGFTTDFDCLNRSLTPTIGAYENTTTPPSVSITETSGLTNNDGIICTGATVNFGVSAGTSYLWAGPNSFSSTMAAPSISNATTAAAGSYTVTVTNGACMATANTAITVNNAPSATITVTNVSCFGGNNGTATATISNGISPYSLMWSTGTTSVMATNLAIGTYTLTTTDANNCINVSNTTITQPTTALNPTLGTPTNVSCLGGSNGSVSATSGGTGTAPYTYLWSNGQTTTTATGLNAGSTGLTVTDANGCVATRTATISQPATAVSATASVTSNYNGAQLSCFGASDGSLTASASGGTGAYTFVWSNGATGATVSGLSAGTHTVTATDANSCVTTTAVTIIQPVPLDIIIASATDVSCNGGADGDATAATNGGTGSTSLVWSNGQTTTTATGLALGTYTVTVTDMNGCTNSTPVTISQPSAVSNNMMQTNASGCGMSDGSAMAMPMGGTPGFSYLWSNGVTNGTNSNLQAGIYTVTITDNNGCTLADNVTITEPSGISLNISANDVTCNGAADGDATASVSGGAGTIVFIWNTGATSATIAGLAANTYQVTATDGNGCRAFGATTISEPSAVSVTISATDVNCFGASTGSAMAMATGGTGSFVFVWSNGATGGNLLNLAAGTYTATATDVNGCVATGTATISQPTSAVSASATKTDATCFGCTDGTANASATGGTGTYLFNWSNGATSAAISNLAAGTYTVTITDANGCTNSTSVVVSQPVGVNEVGTLGDIRLYPNPTLSIAYLENVPMNSRLRLMNQLGQTIWTVEATQTTMTIDLSQLPAAGYWIEVQSEHSRITKLIVKKD